MGGILKIRIVKGRKFQFLATEEEIAPIVQLKFKIGTFSTCPVQLDNKKTAEWNDEVFECQLQNDEEYFEFFVYNGVINEENLLGQSRIGIISFKDKMDHWFPFYFNKKRKYDFMGEIHIIGKFYEEDKCEQKETDADFITFNSRSTKLNNNSNDNNNNNDNNKNNNGNNENNNNSINNNNCNVNNNKEGKNVVIDMQPNGYSTQTTYSDNYVPQTTYSANYVPQITYSANYVSQTTYSTNYVSQTTYSANYVPQTTNTDDFSPLTINSNGYSKSNTSNKVNKCHNNCFSKISDYLMKMRLLFCFSQEKSTKICTYIMLLVLSAFGIDTYFKRNDDLGFSITIIYLRIGAISVTILTLFLLLIGINRKILFLMKPFKYIYILYICFIIVMTNYIVAIDEGENIDDVKDKMNIEFYLTYYCLYNFIYVIYYITTLIYIIVVEKEEKEYGEVF